MKNEDLLKALGDVDPKLLQETDRMRSHGRSSAGRSAILLLVAGLILFAGVAAIWFSVHVRRNSVGASVNETVVLTPEETEESTETTEEAATEESTSETAETVISKEYEGIDEIEVEIKKMSETSASISCRVTCDPGYFASVVLDMTGVDDPLHLNPRAVRNNIVTLSAFKNVNQKGSYQAGILVTVYDSEGNIVNSFARYSESVCFTGE